MAIENCYRNSWFTDEKLWISIAMYFFTRGYADPCVLPMVPPRRHGLCPHHGRCGNWGAGDVGSAGGRLEGVVRGDLDWTNWDHSVSLLMFLVQIISGTHWKKCGIKPRGCSWLCRDIIKYFPNECTKSEWPIPTNYGWPGNRIVEGSVAPYWKMFSGGRKFEILLDLQKYWKLSARNTSSLCSN